MLKSSAGMVGAMALSRLYGERMESSANPARVRTLAEAVRRELAVVLAALEPRVPPA